MSVLLTKGEAVGLPEAGKQVLLVDSTGTPYLLNSDGTRSQVGAGADPGAIVTLGANATDLDVSGLLGDTDGDYEFVFDLLLANSVNVFLQPNALSTNQTSAFTTTQPGGSVTASAARTDWFITDSSTDGGSFGRINLTSKTGRNRLIWVSTRRTAAHIYMLGKWAETATAITSLRFHCDTASGILSGSYVRTQKRGFTV
jgi:hypothetical protein